MTTGNNNALTKFFAFSDVTESTIGDNEVFGVAKPTDILFLGRVVEHGTQAKDDCLCYAVFAILLRYWPITSLMLAFLLPNPRSTVLVDHVAQ